MDLSFSPDQESIRAEFRRFLEGERDAEGDAIWRQMTELGWLASCLPERAGGHGLPAEQLCVLAEESGRRPLAVPFSTCIFGFSAALTALDDPRATEWLLECGAGRCRGALLEDKAWDALPVLHRGDRISGTVRALPDGAGIDALLTRVPASGAIRLIDLRGGHVRHRPADGLDVLHPTSDVVIEEAPVTTLVEGPGASRVWQRLLDRHAVFRSFEMLGGAEACLVMARGHVQQRIAFGRVVGSFQAVKMALANMLVSIEVARSNAFYACWSLEQDEATLAEAACVARIAATQAYRFCARHNIQLHGALGVTQESECHLHYRRAQALGSDFGTLRQWKDRLVDVLEAAAPLVAQEPA